MPNLSFDAFVKPDREHYDAIASSLNAIFDIAEGYGGQAQCAARILCSLYKPKEYFMSGNDLAGLDVPHIHDAAYVLHEYGMCRGNIFRLINDSEDRMIRILHFAQPTK